MVFCVLETFSKKELFVCPTCWFEGDEENGVVYYPPDTKQFLKYQGLQDKRPDKLWCSEPARVLAKYPEYQLAVQGMRRLEEGATSEEGRWDEKKFRKLNALRNISTITTVQDMIDSRKKVVEKPPNPTVTLHPYVSTATSRLPDTSSNRVFGNIDLQDANDHHVDDEFHQLPETEDRTENQNNIVIEMPEITCCLDKIKNDIGTVILTVANIDKKLNKLIEAVANMGTLISKENYQGTLQSIGAIGNTSNFSSLLPINDQYTFNEFETMLRNKDNYQKFVTEMATYGGTSGDKKGDRIAYGLVDQLFTRQFMTECSWTGSSKNQASKNTFSSATTFLDAFYDIINLADSRYSKNDAKDFFKEKILRNAKSRLLNLQQRDEPVKKRRRTVNAPVTVTDTTNAIQTTITEVSDLITIPSP